MKTPDSVRRAGFVGEGLEPGERLFDAILASPSGVVFAVDGCEGAFERISAPGGKINLVIPELLAELEQLRSEAPPVRAEDFPLILSAGERRATTANTLFRDPAWRRRDRDGALRISPADATRLGLADGGRARLTTRRGSLVVTLEVSEMMQPGHVSLPNGQGVDYPAEDGAPALTGSPANELTASADRDWLAGTPHHKHVPARLEMLV